MRDTLLRLIVYATAIAAAAALLPGIHVKDNSIGTLLIVALIFAVLNAFVKPAIMFLSCPFVLVTFGLFLLVINGIMLRITNSLAGSRFEVDGWGAAILGGLVVSIVGGILEGALGLKDKDKKHKKKKTIDDDVVIISR